MTAELILTRCAHCDTATARTEAVARNLSAAALDGLVLAGPTLDALTLLADRAALDARLVAEAHRLEQQAS